MDDISIEELERKEKTIMVQKVQVVSNVQIWCMIIHKFDVENVSSSAFH